MLSLSFATIPDPDGWRPNLRLKGDWLVFKIGDGRHTGYGEASHSNDDVQCREIADTLFRDRIASFDLGLDSLRALERELADSEPGFVEATAWSGINQALYDLLAKREGVPVWRLFRERVERNGVPLYATVNRALESRSREGYLNIAERACDRGFRAIKCAPFERVTDLGAAPENCREGLETLELLRNAFPNLELRVDFHERFSPQHFAVMLPRLEELGLGWLEEPFPMGRGYAELRAKAATPIAGGELHWGTRRFREIVKNGWVDVIMPDVKHVGGFGPLLEVVRMAEGKVEVSPHNPSGPVAAAASLHVAALYPETVTSLEYAFDATGSRVRCGERVEEGFLRLGDRPGWGIELGERFLY